jgi:hypothetical protein
LIKSETERDVMAITVKHLKSEIDQKQKIIRRQNQELEQLRDTVLQMQR